MDSPYPRDDPQRHGKAAYRALLLQEPVMNYKTELGDEPLEIVEIGCGTGAGANLITREVHPTARYLAIAMQATAIDTCKKVHATVDNPGLTCYHAAGGIGHDGRQVPRAAGTVDIVVICETHIAETEIGQLEKDILIEVKRLLKPGGLLVWGNAIPTDVWDDAAIFLNSIGFELAHSANHTRGAIQARDEDA